MPEDNNQNPSSIPPQAPAWPQANQPAMQPVPVYDSVASVEQEATTEPQQFFNNTATTTAPVEQAPVEPQTQPELQPLVQQPEQSTLPGKNKKKKIIVTSIIAGAIIVLGLGGYLAYALWYQNPQNVLGDAISHALNAKTASYKGTVKIDSKDVKVAIDLDGSGVDTTSNTNAKITITTMGKDFKVNGSVLTDKDGNLFFKVGNLRTLLDQYLAESGMAATETPFDNLIAKIDNKWIRVSADDLAEFSKETSDKQKCFSTTLKKLNTDKATKEEFTKIYQKNTFVVVNKTLADRTIGGVDSLGYELSLSKDKTKSFIEAVNNTQLVKDLQKCDSDFKLDANDITKDMSTDPTKDTIEVSISRWSHEFTQVKAEGKDEDDSSATGTIVIEPLFNKDVKIDAPSDYLTLKQLQAEIESAMGGFQEAMQASADATVAEADASHQQMMSEMDMSDMDMTTES